MAIISIKNLVHKYAKHDDAGEEIGSFTAVDDISLDVNKGEFIAVLGHNGSGKSTMAKHINALLYPTSGKVYVNDNDTTVEENILTIRNTAGMVFQNPDNQIIATVVEEDVAFGPENMGVETGEIRLRVDEALRAVNISEYRKNSPNKLSGGQKQRVAIAGVLAMKPECIILDEPTAMLDPVGRKEVINTVARLNKENNMTVILVTHHMDEVVGADRVIVMEHGKIVKNGTPYDVLSKVEEMKSLGLDVPQVTEISYEINKKYNNFKVVLNIDEFVKQLTSLKKNNHDIYKNIVPFCNVNASINNFNDSTNKYNKVKSEDLDDNKIDLTVENDFDDSFKNDSIENINSFDSFSKNSKELMMSLKNVSHVYGENTAFEQTALKDINLDIFKNEFIALIGHTGSGKSTLIQHFNALEKPTKGNVYYLNEDINGESYNRKNLRTKVGLVFQYPDHQLFEMTILKDVMFGPKNQGLSEEKAKEEAKKALKLVGIGEDLWEESPFDLSGGQKKRVTIAGVLAMKPDILILDEPAAGLDPVGRDEILGKIYDIYKETGITVVLVSHSMEDVAKYATRIVVMNKGCAVYDDLPVKVFRNYRELSEIGLSVPQVTELVHRLKNFEPNIDTNIIKVSEYLEKAGIWRVK